MAKLQFSFSLIWNPSLFMPFLCPFFVIRFFNLVRWVVNLFIVLCSLDYPHSLSDSLQGYRCAGIFNFYC